jgi:hypothetical protein
LRHHSSTVCPQAGRSFTRISGRSFTTELSTPHTGHGPSRAICSMIILTAVGPDPLHKQDAELALQTE